MKRTVIASVALIAAQALVACNASVLPTLAPTAAPQTPNVVKGVGLSPHGFPRDYSKLGEFFAEVGNMPNSGAMWNGGWQENGAGQIPEAAALVAQSAAQYHFTSIVVFGWRNGETLLLSTPNNSTNDWSNTEARTLYSKMVADFAATYQPPFIFLGNENDIYYEQDPNDYTNWLQAYNAAYDAIKSASPETLVGPVFNFEHLSGSGALSGWTTPHWEALVTHDLTKVDVTGVTLYPWLNFATADSVPANYLDPLFARIGEAPIAITETGWPAENESGLALQWETSEAAQVTYLSKLGAMLDGKSVQMVNWLFVHQMIDPGGDSTDWQLFGSISLKDAAGEARPVYELWLGFNP